MRNCKELFLLVVGLFLNMWAMSQTSGAPVSNNDGLMRSEGKIYVVMAVCVIILIGLIFYLMRLERKISRLEKGGTL